MPARSPRKRGDAILVGRSVTNKGNRTRRTGKADLAAGNEIVLQPVGSDARIAVSGGTGDVTNQGTVKAAQAELASAGGNVYALAENGAGVISATGTKTVNGHVWLTAGGDAQVSGTITAKNADGSGGTVSVIADGSTTVTGTIRAAGDAGHKGGSIETSGHTLAIGGATIDAGQGGQWLLDPVDLTVDASAASTIDGALASNTDVTLQTTATTASGSGTQTSGNGDIIIASALSWGTSAKLTLDAYNAIFIDAPISVTGGGGVVLNAAYDTTTVSGLSLLKLNFARGDSIDYGAIDNGGTLSINGTGYTLLYSMSDVQNINAGLNANYALATSLDASGVTGWVPIGTDGAGHALNSYYGFRGIFDGLGNTISNLTVNTGSYDYAGLFGETYGTLRNIGLIGGSVTGNGFFVGGLAGVNGGVIVNAYATGAVIGGTYYAGGLAGLDSGTVVASYATGAVSGGILVGGLIGAVSVGVPTVTIVDAYATGAVNGTSYVGGLVGSNSGGSTVRNSYAIGAVQSTGTSSLITVGGLIGYNSSSCPVSNSYWDIETSGQSAGIGTDYSYQTVTGQTTAQLQGTLPSGFEFERLGHGHRAVSLFHMAISDDAAGDHGLCLWRCGRNGAGLGRIRRGDGLGAGGWVRHSARRRPAPMATTMFSRRPARSPARSNC